MKTHDEKAKELVDKYKISFGKLGKGDLSFSIGLAKQCALIDCQNTIDELLDFRERATNYNNKRIKYWIKVKESITNLKA